MILYLDTSALVKLFVAEEHTDSVRQAVSEARLTVTHAIAYVEACATFARAARLHGDESLFSALRGNLDALWKACEILSVSESMIHRAATLAGRHRLRGYNSLHLAAAESAFEAFHGQISFHFAVFDVQLKDAANQAGIPLLQA